MQNKTDVKIQIIKKTPYKINEKWLKNTAKKIFDLTKKRGNYECEINIICPARMKALNKKFRNKNKATTILSFVAKESKDFVLPPSKYQYLGEIFLCPSIIKKENQDPKISTEKMMTLFLVHGILHLLGYTHKDEKGAKKMETLEQKIIGKI